MEIVPYGGWNRCARIVAGNTEALVTLEVGPRVIRYGRINGPNELVEYPKDMGQTGGSEYRSYGGHRLWIAPEENPKTLHPDNEAIQASESDGWVAFTAPVESWFVQKEIRVRAQGAALVLEHRIYNRGVYPIELSPWTLTVMAPGGVCVFPQPKSVPHSDKVLPARPLVLWNYTDMADPRWTWGNRVARLAHDPNLGPQKVGAFVEQGIAVYSNRGNTFVKRFAAEPEYVYPDFGCNFETFTREDMLEVESLGPLESIPPGEYASHTETWYLLTGETAPASDAECGDWLDKLIESCPYLD